MVILPYKQGYATIFMMTSATNKNDLSVCIGFQEPHEGHDKITKKEHIVCFLYVLFCKENFFEIDLRMQRFIQGINLQDEKCSL